MLLKNEKNKLINIKTIPPTEGLICYGLLLFGVCPKLNFKKGISPKVARYVIKKLKQICYFHNFF